MVKKFQGRKCWSCVEQFISKYCWYSWLSAGGGSGITMKYDGKSVWTTTNNCTNIESMIWMQSWILAGLPAPNFDPHPKKRKLNVSCFSCTHFFHLLDISYPHVIKVLDLQMPQKQPRTKNIHLCICSKTVPKPFMLTYILF